MSAPKALGSRESKALVVQIDIDGTLDAAPAFFRWLTASLRSDGYTVLIVSSRVDSLECRTATIAELREWSITYDELHLAPEAIDPDTLPRGVHPAHRVFAHKLTVARARGTAVLFDDCSITAELFARYAPHVTVFRPMTKA